MINPRNITNYNRTDYELEEFLLFCISVAGHNAMTTARHLDCFLSYCKTEYQATTPFDCIRKCPDLVKTLQEFAFGRYNILSRSFYELVNSGIDIKKCSRDDLVNIFGIGMKTASYFLLHSRRNMDIACLDIYILRFLQSIGYNVPKTSPSGKKYLDVEKYFLYEAKKRQVSPSVLDLDIWKASHVRS